MKRTLLLLLFVLPLVAGDFRLGQAAVKITPPAGAPMAGYYHNRAASGVHDDLFAKTLVLEKDGEKAALVACDIIGMPRGVAEEARRLAEKETGIPGARIMISGTHAHTGPVLYEEGSRYNLEGDMLRIAREYIAALPAKIAESIKLADSRLQPAKAAAGVGHEESISFNRRFFMKDGTVGWNPGKLNPNIVRPAGPIDPDVGVVRFEAADGGPLATYVNFALHLDTVGGVEISADYPYTVSKLLGRLNGADMLTMFTIGAAGNLNHINVKTAARQNGHGEAERIGGVLAGEVLKTYTRLEDIAAASVRSRSEIVRLPLAGHEPSDVEWARGVAPKFGKPDAAPFLDLVKAFRVLDVEARKGNPIDAEVQVIALGDKVAWVGLPGEIFTELGMAIKRASPFPYTMVTELANGSIGYVPNRESYPQGAYEAISARCAAGSGEMLVDTALRLLRGLKAAGAATN